MISGGKGEGGKLSSVEIYNPETRGACWIANMPTSRYGTVSKEFLVCGGMGDGGHAGDCVLFNPKNGTWENAHKLNQERWR